MGHACPELASYGCLIFEETDVASESHPESEHPPAALNGHGAARRRLARAGLGAAGVLVTIESRATLHHGPICVAPSAALSSGADSTYTKGRVTCAGRGPDYWCRMSHYWPCSRNIKFGELFHCKGGNTKYANVKLVDILGQDKYEGFIGRHLAATYLNILTGKISFLNERTLDTMWSELQTTGLYRPAPKVYWPAQVVRLYLEATYLD